MLSAVIRALWGVTGGVPEGTTNSESGSTLSCANNNEAHCTLSPQEHAKVTNIGGKTLAYAESTSGDAEVTVISSSSFGKGSQSSDSLPPLRPAASADGPPAAVGAAVVHECVDSLRLDNIRKEHDIAKAVKSDDAAVPVHLWDERLGNSGVENG